MIISIDLSKRSTGVCALDMNGNLIDFLLVHNEHLHEEELFIYNISQIVDFSRGLAARYVLEGFVTEALALHAPSKDKDQLFGQFWILQYELAKEFATVPRGKITVAEWRSSVLTKAEQRELKAEDSKNGLKIGCVRKLPEDVRERFEHYLAVNKVKRIASKEPLYDLSDAYHIGKYRLSYGRENKI